MENNLFHSLFHLFHFIRKLPLINHYNDINENKVKLEGPLLKPKFTRGSLLIRKLSHILFYNAFIKVISTTYIKT